MLAVCILVNPACMIISFLSQYCEMSLRPIAHLVLGDIFFCVPTTGHHYDIITGLNCTMVGSVSDCEWARSARRSIHWYPLSCVWIRSTDEENSIFCCRAAVVSSFDCCVLQMLPRSLFINLTGVLIASNQVARHKVHCWVPLHRSWIVLEDTAPLLNWPRCRWWLASYDQESPKV